MVKKRIIVIPKRYLKTSKGRKTRYLQSTKSGRMQGRQGANRLKKKKYIVARTDNSFASNNVRRLTKNLDVDKDKKVDYYSGQIFGRSKKVKVRGSRKRKATIRRL